MLRGGLAGDPTAGQAGLGPAYRPEPAQPAGDPAAAAACRQRSGSGQRPPCCAWQRQRREYTAPIRKRCTFHEIGGLDTLLDLAGTFAAVSHLGVEQVLVSPLPLARGSIMTMHGLLPLPAPATLQLLKDVPTYGVPLEAELVTPTGAVLAVSLASGFGPPPLARWERFGYGAGSKDLPQQPNVLRAWLGESCGRDRRRAWRRLCRQAAFDEDLVLVLETQLDDQSPELLPYLRAQLERGGAIDVLFTPTVMKKGRPGNIVTVLSPREKLLALTHILFRESSALGLRWYPAGRLKLFRTVEEVSTPYGAIPVKTRLCPATGRRPGVLQPGAGVRGLRQAGRRDRRQPQGDLPGRHRRRPGQAAKRVNCYCRFASTSRPSTICTVTIGAAAASSISHFSRRTSS